VFGLVAATAKAQSASSAKTSAESHGPLQYACKDGTKFAITFVSEKDREIARIRVNGQSLETLVHEMTGSSTVYSNSHWSFYEWRDTTSLIDMSRKPPVEKSCRQVAAASRAKPHSPR
jgi:hypothetical protein